jgi:DNA-binding NarL/FixJ family response regulator
VIASRLRMSRNTVHTHLERLYRKVSVTSRSQLIVRLFHTYMAIRRDSESLPHQRSQDVG